MFVGECIYKEIIVSTIEGAMHSFSSDSVEDIKTLHCINIFFQSETSVTGMCHNYFGQLEYATKAMDHKRESKMLLDLINKCLPGFTGEIPSLFLPPI